VNDDLDILNAKLSDLDALCVRQRLARDHAALFPARLALARWRGSGIPALPMPSSLPASEAIPPRAEWFARFMRDHQAWLDRGGFAQHEELPALRQPTMWQPPLAAPALASASPALDAATPTPGARPAADGDNQQCGACR
jgi:hypothetical protein